ncbi:hypothetical protein WJX79_002335 [Trebouxia sp. C0005]
MEWDHISKFKTVVAKREGRHALVTLARPSKSNALDDLMWAEIPQIFHALDQMDDVYAVVLTGQAVQGACFGAGVDIITACDIRYSTQAATFCVKEVDVAIVADVGTLQRLPPIVGQGVASELALTARVIKGEEARQLGLVSQCFADETALLQHAHKTAELIASKSPLAVVGTKRVLVHARDHSVPDGLDYVAAYNAAMLPSADIQEVFKAVVKERRAPNFSKL